MKRVLTGLMAAVCVAGAAEAAALTQSGTIAPMHTNWTATFQVDQFDSMGGALTLESVVIEIVGRVSGNLGAENRDSFAKLVTLNMNVDFEVMMGAESMADAGLTISESLTLAPFDGMIDFIGPSGASYIDVTDATTATTTRSIPVDDLNEWVGPGQVELEAAATAFSFVTGGGNLAAFFETTASLDWMVVYTFRGNDTGVLVPTPTAAVLGLAGLSAVAGVRRRRA